MGMMMMLRMNNPKSISCDKVFDEIEDLIDHYGETAYNIQALLGEHDYSIQTETRMVRRNIK